MEPTLTYEERLAGDPDWASLERQLYFQEQSAAHLTVRRLTKELEKRRIDYAIAGDLCMFSHGYRRFTDIVEVLVTLEGLGRIHRELVGHGYTRPSENDFSIRDAKNGVRIKFLISGQYPGEDALQAASQLG